MVCTPLAFVDGWLAARCSAALVDACPRHPKPRQMETCARRMLSPVFAWFRRAVPSYGSVVRVEDENEIAFRLLGWLRSQRVSYDRVRVGSTIDFWWSFVDVDLDLENWGDRLPLVPMVTALIDAGPCGRDLSDTLARAVRLRQLDRLLASPFGPTWAVQLRRSPGVRCMRFGPCATTTSTCCGPCKGWPGGSGCTRSSVSSWTFCGAGAGGWTRWLPRNNLPRNNLPPWWSHGRPRG